MNFIERMPEIKNKDLYSQNGEGLLIEYVMDNLLGHGQYSIMDIGCGDCFILSNSRHLRNIGWGSELIDKDFGKGNGFTVTKDNILDFKARECDVISIDIDGNDYWILDSMLSNGFEPTIIVAEFNAMYTDSRTIAYNPDHVWGGDSYYGFTFEAGKKLAEKHGYKVIFQVADMNMIMVRADLVEGLHIPEVTYKQNDFFKLSERTDWIFV